MSIDKSHELQDVYIHNFYKALDCPKSLAAWILYKNKEYSQLVNLEWDPAHYKCVGTARDALAAVSLLAKANFLDTGIDKEAVAMKKFAEAEEQCRLTNIRFRAGGFSHQTHAALLAARRKISFILGKFDSHEFIEACNWGPGATLNLPRRRSTHPEKFRSENGITAGAYGFVKNWFSAAYPLWDLTFEIQSGNKVITVPKNAKTDRIIAIEPGINLWFQKGLGSMIRRRLRNNGIDLNSQSHNGEFARISSKYGHLATVDFSSASDTISYEVVKELLPMEWFLMLVDFRSVRGSLSDGTIVKYEKFSSMGNGYTFELESLIFFALASALCDNQGVKGPISVFGDDVIIPTEVFYDYSHVCHELGFRVNKTKSFFSGYFRESCGSYWFNGRDVKPIFLKESFDGQASVISCANSLRTFARRRNLYGCDHSFEGTWHSLASYLLNLKVPKIPAGLGDIGLISSDDEFDVADKQKAKRGYEGYYFRAIATLTVSRYENRKGYLLTRLKAIGWSSMMAEPSMPNQVPLPGCVRYSRTRVLVPRWEDIGPWV